MARNAIHRRKKGSGILRPELKMCGSEFATLPLERCARGR